MSRLRKLRRTPSARRLETTRRLQTSWRSWSLRRTQRRLEREYRRHLELQIQLDNHLLRLKELELREQTLQEELEERQLILQHRQGMLDLTPQPALALERELLEQE